MTLSTAWFPPVDWFALLAAKESVYLEACESYRKQTWRNRCRIAMPSGPQDLVIPVVASTNHTPIRDIRLSDHGNWRHHHWSALRTAYGKSPFFEYYADDFAPFYLERRFDFLFDFNEALRELVCSLIDIETPVTRSDRFLAADFPSLSETISPYYQVFAPRLGFLPDLSVADLLFNMGPEAIFVLQKEN